jgi:hypothetical protein
LWMAYGGAVTFAPSRLASPSPRFDSVTALIPAPKVEVPLTVMLPLGPETVAL